MKKTRLLIARCLTLLVLALLSTNLAWGADKTYSFTPDATTTGSSATAYVTSAYSFTYNEIGWSFNQWNPSSLQIKTNQSSAGSEFNFKNTSAFPGKIKSVVITFSALTVSDESKLCFVGGTSAISSLSGGSAGTWNSTAKTLTWTPADGTNYTYFAFYQNGKAASGTNNLASSDAIVITYEDADTPSKELVSLAVSGTPTKTTYEAGESFDPTGLAVTGTYSEGDPEEITSGITWTFDPNPLTVGTTSVSVTATVGDITSDAYQVNGLTVTAAQKWAKVTADKTDWSGEYLLVYENNSTAYVWTGVDAADCNATATISNNQISKPTGAVSLTIAAMDDGYSILVNGGTNDGKYISGTSSNNKINFGATASANTITYPYADNNNSVKIVSNTATMRYNNASNNNRFRYFGSAGQQNVQLYEKVLPPTNEAVTFAAPEGGSLVIKNGENPIASGATIQNGTVLDVTFGMTPAEAYKDVAIKVTKTDGGDDVTSTVYNATKKQITMPRYAITVAVTSTKLYKISLVTAGEGEGSATMNGVTTDIYVDGETQIDLVASAVAPNEFTSWSATENIMIDEETDAETYAFASGDGTITATFGISTLLPLDAPTLSEPTNITYSGVTLNWEALDNAEAYNVELLLNDETVASDVITGATSWTPEVTLQANTTYTYTVQGVGDGITYAENNNPKAQSTVTTADYPAAVLTLSENGITSTIDGKLNTPIVLPTTSTQTCEDKVFVGWSATTIDGVTDTKPSLLGETYTFTDSEQLTATIYAVYAKETKGEVTWNKVSTNYTDWNGNEFLIVYESEATKGYVMKSEDATSNYVEATIASGVIASKPEGAMSVIIEKYGTTNDYQLRVAGESPAKYINGKSSNGLSFDASAQQTTISYDNTYGWLISNNSSWLRYNTTSGQTRFRFYKSGTYTDNSYKSVQLYKKTQDITYSNYCTTVSVESVPVTINRFDGKDEGNASFCSTFDLDFTNVAGAKAYIAVSADNDKITLSRRNKIPAGTGIFVIGTPDTYDIPTTTDVCDDVTGNMLTGTIVPYTVQDDDNIWALSKTDGKLYYIPSGRIIGAGKAYLNESLNTVSLSLFIVDEPTGITSYENDNENDNMSTAIFNLQGMRITTPKKGDIYIMNGKKFLMK